jgi:hypothetical protein
MTKDYANLPPTAMRRSDRAQEDNWIRKFLHTASVGMMATVHEDQPYIHSSSFAYDEGKNCLYFHTAHAGRTRANIEIHEKVCFSVTEMGRLLPADSAKEFSVEYAGVMVFGRAQVIQDKQEAIHALQLLMDKYAPHLKPDDNYERPVEDDLLYTAVYRIDIESWSGKKKEAEADFPDAYWYPDSPMLDSNKTSQKN